MKQEASQREVELHDDSPWTIARLVQFCYLGTYDVSLNEAQLSQSLSIMELVCQGDFPTESEKQEEEARGAFEID